MRKRIRQIARGKFEYEKPSLALQTEEIKLQVTEGLEYSGSFVIKSSNQIPVRGVVYSTSPRMECLTPQFEGEEVRIRYQFHSRGLVEGDMEKGDFVIVCNQSEHSLSFCVSISRLYADSSSGPVKSLYDFACLARENWHEAYRLFYQKDFSNIISPREEKEAMLYRGFMGAKPSQQNMEEFLIGIGKKKPVQFSLGCETCRIEEMTETARQTVELKKDEWGYLMIHISADADFIRLPETGIATEDFIGSSYPCSYLIDYGRMHAGWNFARIYFETAYDTKVLTVEAHRGAVKDRRASARSQIREGLAGIMELYQAYRLRRIVTGVWSNETVEILNHLHELVPDEPMYLLMKAQALHINRQRQEAEWILNDFKREWDDRRSPVWGYYLYIMTLMEREPTYVDKMTREIELIFHDNPDSVLLFWILLFLQEEYYNNNAHKLKSIAYWVMRGTSTPYLYLEAYYLICQDPYLIARLGPFEERILRWAMRRHALNRELAAQIFEIVEPGRGFDSVHYELLCAAYEVDPKPEYVGRICSYLIRAQRYDGQYHHWFEMGIEQNLRITSLYEAYLLSFDDRGIMPVPKIIQMYFQYGSSISWHKMAILYNNIIAAKEREPEVYRQYRRTMGRFAMEQVEQGHMDDSLAVLYEEMLDFGYVNQEIAGNLARILFTHKLVVFDREIVRAVIYQKQLSRPQIVPVVDRAAYFVLYTNDYVILFEDEKGFRYVGSVSFQLEQLMNPLPYLEKCMELVPDELPYLIAAFDQKQSYLAFTKEDEKYFPRILSADELDPYYRSAVALEIVRYDRTREPGQEVTDYLSGADYEKMTKSVRGEMLEALVERGMFEQAYGLVQTYGIDQISPSAGMALADSRIEQEGDCGEPDEFLVLLAEYAFSGGCFDESILSWLCRFYNGPTERMCGLWRAAREADVDTLSLEERILVQMLYAKRRTADVSGIFESYYNGGGGDLVVLAYLSACCHDYFVANAPLAPELFELLLARHSAHLELNDACRLALLKSLAERGEDERPDVQEELLCDFTRRNMSFAFFRQLNRRLVNKYHLYDKVFLEYRTNPRNHVVLHYSRDEDGENFVKEDMTDVCYGIFVKPFVLFFGESVRYYITEEHGNQVDVSAVSKITNSEVYAESDGSRYSRLNQMLISKTLEDEASLEEGMKQYAMLDEATRRVFRLM